MMICVLITLLVITNSAFSDDTSQTKLAKYYDMVITEKIHQSLSKADLKDSKSEILRDCAALESEKAAFLSANKDSLIEEMIEQEVGRKLYKIDFYLNKVFFDSKREAASGETTG